MNIFVVILDFNLYCTIYHKVQTLLKHIVAALRYCITVIFFNEIKLFIVIVQQDHFVFHLF